jgi:hypothetical protein
MTCAPHRLPSLCSDAATPSRALHLPAIIGGTRAVESQHFERRQRGGLHFNGTQVQLTIRRRAHSGSKSPPFLPAK